MATVGLDYTLNYITSGYHSGVTSINVLKEHLKTLYLGVWFVESSPYFEILNEKVLQLLAGGILQRHEDYQNFPKGNIKLVQESSPLVLTMDHLGMGFLFCLVPLAIGIAVFAIEKSIQALTILRNKFVLLNVVKAYMRARKQF